jgi:hypothetical protein
MEDLKKLKIKNWNKIAKDRRTWRDLAEKAKNPQRVMMMIIIICVMWQETFATNEI